MKNKYVTIVFRVKEKDMINFAVVDDNKLHRKKISNIIISSMMNNKIDFKIHEFDDYNNELLDFVKNDKQDSIYLLDIELPSGDGVDVARKIRNIQNNWISPIIIITAHTSLSYEIYRQRLQILDFIGKCEDIDKNLSENIDLCLKMLNKERVYRYTYKKVEYTISLNQIDYIQRDGRQTKIVTHDNEYYQNISINEIKELLPSYFVSSAKGVLLNIKNVEKIDWSTYKVYFKDKRSEFLVSRTHKKELDSYDYV